MQGNHQAGSPAHFAPHILCQKQIRNGRTARPSWQNESNIDQHQKCPRPSPETFPRRDSPVRDGDRSSAISPSPSGLNDTQARITRIRTAKSLILFMRIFIMFRFWWLRTKGSASEKRDGRSLQALSRFGAKRDGRSRARRSKLDWNSASKAAVSSVHDLWSLFHDRAKDLFFNISYCKWSNKSSRHAFQDPW